MSSKTTLITHIFNEEYLLPFWLNHHKDMFDDIIIIDYNSTDKSIEICKSICPDCKILKTMNEYFGAEEIDAEVMSIEEGVEGIKMVLNTTEFLFCETSVKDVFIDNVNPMSYAIDTVSPYSVNTYNITTLHDLFKNMFNDDVVYHRDRLFRQLHNFPNGNYHIGRHNTYNVSTSTDKVHLVWFGYYPMNKKILERKLQIQKNIPQKDKDRHLGHHHFVDREQLLSNNRGKASNGALLKNINEPLYNLLKTKYI